MYGQNILFRVCLSMIFLLAPVGQMLHGQEVQTKKERLSENVNTVYSEFLPLLSPNGKTLFYIRENNPDSFGGQDIWFSELQADGTWGIGKNVGIPLNNSAGNAVFSLLADGKKILLSFRYNSDGSYQGGGYSISTQINGVWGVPKSLEIRNYVNYSRWNSAALSSDGKVLLMTLQDSTSLGETDVYVSFLQNDNTWTQPKNLGSPVSSTASEVSVFLAADDVSLYYASDRQGGFGSSDVWVTRRLDDTWLKWSEPENLGPIINTSESENSYMISSAGDYAYFASNNGAIGQFDIFRIPMPTKSRPQPVMSISGTVRERSTKQPLEATISIIDAETNKEVGASSSNSSDGAYSYILQKNKRYSLVAKNPDYPDAQATVSTLDLTQYTELKKDFYLEKAPPPPSPPVAKIPPIQDQTHGDSALPKVNAVGVFDDKSEDSHLTISVEEFLRTQTFPLLNFVFFDAGSASLPKRYIQRERNDVATFDERSFYGSDVLNVYYDLLNIIGARLQKNPSAAIQLVGCNDNQGTEAGNTTLSKQRAEVVRDYLRDIWNISESRMSIKAQNLPARPSTLQDPDGIAENRRVEIFSSSSDIVQPIAITDTTRVVTPPSVRFYVQSSPSPLQITQWHLGATQRQKEIFSSEGTSTLPPVVEWKIQTGEEPRYDSILTYSMMLNAIRARQQETELKTPENNIPVDLITIRRKKFERRKDNLIEEYRLILFDFNSSRLGNANEEIINFIKCRVAENLNTVSILGYTDRIGDEKSNLKLSSERASATKEAILSSNSERCKLKPNIRKIFEKASVKGVGESEPMADLDNDLPEGRFYSRTVKIILTIPVQY